MTLLGGFAASRLFGDRCAWSGSQEIEPEIERYVNDGYMGGLELLRVIHGQGAGALRKAVREQLEAHPLGAGVSPAPKGRGGEGVTVATLTNNHRSVTNRMPASLIGQ